MAERLEAGKGEDDRFDYLGYEGHTRAQRDMDVTALERALGTLDERLHGLIIEITEARLENQ